VLEADGRGFTRSEPQQTPRLPHHGERKEVFGLNIQKILNANIRDTGKAGKVINTAAIVVSVACFLFLILLGVTYEVAHKTKSRTYLLPIWGLSMDNTVEQWSRVLKFGAFVLVNRQDVARNGDIIIFQDPRPKAGWDIKRVSWISEDQRMMKVASDNFKQTGADSQTEPALAELQTSSIKGVVTNVISIQWLVRGLTSRGRAENWLRFHFRDRPQWDPLGRYAAITGEGGIHLYDCSGGQPKLLIADKDFAGKDTGSKVVWRNGKAVWSIISEWSYGAMDLTSHRVERFRALPNRIVILGRIDEKHLVAVSDVTHLLHPGELYEGHRIRALQYPYVCPQFCGPADLAHTKITLE